MAGAEHDGDEALPRWATVADVHPFLCAAVEATGDRSLFRQEFRPDPARLLQGGGLDPDEDRWARRQVVEALAAQDLSEPDAVPTGLAARLGEDEVLDEQLLRDILAFLVGGSAADWEEFLLEELAPPGRDRRAPTWHVEDADAAAWGPPATTMSVAVIGAGMSGLAVAYRLRQAGVQVTVFEKNPDVGGTWFDNTYPGCRVDVPNRLYSYSFAQTDGWSHRFSPQAELLDYFRAVADDLGLRDAIRFGTEVLAASWDAEASQWKVRVDDGTERVVTADAVVSAVGQLNRPSYPAIAGRERFAGPSFHSARWDRAIELEGKRVAVIGTGASACQFVPELIGVAAHVDVYQRTPPWLAPSPGYRDPIGDAERELLARLPAYGRWDRLWQFWQVHESLWPAAQVDPDWHEDGTVSQLNSLVRDVLVAHISEQVKVDDPIHDQVVPRYPPISKRIIRDDGSWLAALQRDDVDLVSEPITEITETGVTTGDGRERPADVLIYGTGFTASDFLTPMRVVGADGVELHDRWQGDARAYLGMTMPGYPNLFLLYGPNTNLVINGSIITFVECQARYVVEALGALRRSGHRAMACREVVHDAYNVEIDAANATMAWARTDVPSWYRNAKGRVSQNWPHDLLTYWQRTRHPDLADYELTRGAPPPPVDPP